MGEEPAHVIQYMFFQRDSGWSGTVKKPNMRVAVLFLYLEVADCTRSHSHCAACSGLHYRGDIERRGTFTTDAIHARN